METNTVQTRIPLHLWDALKDTFYEHDQQFLRDVAPLLNVPVAELKQKILGARGALTNICVLASDEAWWERELCPLYVRTDGAVWRRCGQPREAHGTCCRHQFWDVLKDPNVRRYADIRTKVGCVRRPVRWEGRIVWVSDAGDVYCSDTGDIIPDLRICPKSGMVL
jgi:hypothetical protein